jgi:hypothetical protein
MKHVFLLLLSVVTLNTFSQSYKEPVSFKSDLWLVQTFEEGTYVPPDTISINWDIKKIKPGKQAIYVDISEKGTLIGIKYPSKLTLSSEGLPNNGFIVEKWITKYSMYIQSTVKDETGYIWTVTVGKDAVSDDNKGLENGRIYVVIEDPKRIKPSWYFTIKSFVKNT